jgi:hypothetical protein
MSVGQMHGRIVNSPCHETVTASQVDRKLCGARQIRPIPAPAAAFTESPGRESASGARFVHGLLERLYCDTDWYNPVSNTG